MVGSETVAHGVFWPFLYTGLVSGEFNQFAVVFRPDGACCFQAKVTQPHDGIVGNVRVTESMFFCDVLWYLHGLFFFIHQIPSQAIQFFSSDTAK